METVVCDSVLATLDKSLNTLFLLLPCKDTTRSVDYPEKQGYTCNLSVLLAPQTTFHLTTLSWGGVRNL